MQALQCYRTQIETIGKVYHGYLACLYVHDAQAARPDLQISPVGGFDFMIDRCAFTEPMYAVRDARNKAGETADEALGENAPPEARKAYYCGLVVPKAKAYAITMPDRIQSVARDLGLAIEQIGRLDDGLLERFDSFHERVEPLVQMAMLKAQVDGQYETMHAFFDPDGSVMLGTAWALEEATDTLEDLAEQHRPHIQDAVKDVEECGKESPVEGPPTFQDFLAALVEANDASDVKFGRKIDLVIMEAKVGLDGSVDFVIGQGLQTVLYHDAAQGSFGVKLGAGVSVETPIIPTGVGGGAYFRFDDTAGPGLEWSASGSAGGVEGTRTETFWFDAHFR
jgi:hypothetical protein